MQILMVGYGAMAKAVMQALPKEIAIRWLVVREGKVQAVQHEVGSRIQVVSKIDDIQGMPDAVIEVAGQSALQMHLPKAIAFGVPIGIISVGAFADDQWHQSIVVSARKYGSRLHVLSGAIAGVDALSAAKHAGLDEVIYQGRKPPAGWQGSHAEHLVNLSELTEAVTFYRGTAREAAQLFPANTNVAATLALAGIGMDQTTVELTADPNIGRNQHQVKARGAFGQLALVIEGDPLKDNPKTSQLAAMSVVRFCHDLINPIIIA